MKTFRLILAISLLTTALSAEVYRNPNAPLEDRVEDALSRLTLNEKIALIHAQSKFSSPGVARLGIPGLWCTDGPHGIRAEVLWDEWNTAGWTNDSVVAFPALTCLAATWNPEMAAAYGHAIGEEALYRGKNVLLGPGVNIYRTPLNGRNFEYMGEDPYLSSKMVVPYVRQVQNLGVATCVKHYALNNQEYNRHGVNVHVSDRALYELYLPAFRAAIVEGGSWSIMGAYNKYNEEYACHNHRLLVDILRGEWGFDGAVISDWGGCLSTEQAIRNGLDLEMGSWTNGLTEGASNAYDMYYMAQPYLSLIREHKVGTEELDDKVRNILRLILRTSMRRDRESGALCSEEHYQVARQVAEEGIVLLKNTNNLLPLRRDQRVLVVGENAIKPMTIGGGSSSLKVQREVSPLRGLEALADADKVRYVRGYVGAPNTVQDGMVGIDLSDTRSVEQLREEAIAAAKESDVVVFVGGLNKEQYQDCEGVDRLSYNLPYGQDELIQELAQANPNLVVVLVSGNAVAMPWVDRVGAVVEAWFAGSEAGTALANVLYGEVNPSGKLPFSIFPALSDYPCHQMGSEVYPGVDNEEYYREDIFVGYRYADLSAKQRKSVTGVACKMQPVFPFGHGLSYTTFAYSDLQLSATSLSADEELTVRVAVTNTGDRAGKETVQLYIADKKSSVLRPVKELKAFDKVFLLPGETKIVQFTIGKEALSFFDEAQHEWVAEPGQFEVIIGSSSRDLRLRANFTLK